MKANRKFVTEEEAVSPVIAVILMVAITVVLAATVFVLVSDIGGQTGGSAPSISWNLDESSDRISVTSAAQGADWSRLAVRVSGCTQAADNAAGWLGAAPTPFHNKAAADGAAGVAGSPAVNQLNDIAAGTECGAGNYVDVSGTTTAISAGDFLEFCADVEGGAMTNVQVQIRDKDANSIVHQVTFLDWADC